MSNCSYYLLHTIYFSGEQTMKQYKFTVVVNSPMNIKDILWAFTHKLKDAFPIVSISFDEIKEDKKDESPYEEIPERY